MLRSVLCAMGCISVLASTALADLPAPMQVTFTMRQNPLDPQSPVTFVTRLDLSAVDSDGDAIGWHVDQITIQQNMGIGYRQWSEVEPNLNTADGLWWISHADASHPNIAEFAQMPSIGGRAVGNISDGELDYDLAGRIAEPLHVPNPTPTALASLDYWFWPVGEEGPADEGVDEDAEIDEGDNDPS